MQARTRHGGALVSALALLLASGCGGSGDGEPADSAATAAVSPPESAAATGAGVDARPDAQMQAVLDAHAALGPKPLGTLTPEEARRQPTPTDAVMAVLRRQGRDTAAQALAPGVTSRDRTIPGPGGALPVRVYTPEGAGPFPVVVYYHGGGWVIASKEVYDGGARGLAKGANAIVVSVDYRLAPEHKFPAAHDDAFAAYQWALQNAATLNGDTSRVAVAGESAGGNLALATAMAARDARVKLPAAIVAVYPIAGSDTTTPSYVEHATAKPLDRAGMSWFFGHYLRNAEDRRDPRINLVGANLEGLPPTTVINAQIDPLRSEGEALADRLRSAGVEVQQRTWPGVTHEFFGMAPVVDKAKEAQAMAVGALTARLGGRP